MAHNQVKAQSFRPSFSGKTIPRPGLFEKLDGAVKRGRQLVCLTAPAGYGKTVLISSWLKTYDGISIWVPCDSLNIDFPRFIFQLVALIQTRLPGFCSEITPLLSNIKPDEFTALQNCFFDCLSSVPEPILFCFDDFHLIEEPEIYRFLVLLVDRLPAVATIILISRTRPPLPTARFRVRCQLLELTAADLRFSSEETKAFIQANHELSLTDDEINTLTEKTEGWAAAIHLAAMVIASGKTGHETDSFIRSISGNQEYITSYLMDEVFSLQEGYVQDFLLKTSVVNRFNIFLSAALSEISAEKADSIMNRLIQNNLFFLPLDSNNQWFRYHHLFSSFLRSRLVLKQSVDVDHLLYIAGVWFQTEGYLEEAVDCALQRERHDQAVEIILENWPRMLHEGNIDLMINWCKRLSSSVFISYPGINIAYAWALMLQGDFSSVPSKLNMFDRATGEKLRLNPDYSRTLEWKQWQIEKMLLTALLEYSRHQSESGLEFANKAKETAHPDFPLLEGNAWIISGHLYKQMGQISESLYAFQTGIPMTWREGNTQALIGAHTALANLLADRGELIKAAQICHDGIRLAAENRMAETPAAAPLYIALAYILIELNRLDEAEEILNKGLTAGRINHSLIFLFNSVISQIRLLIARGKADEALEVVDGVSHYITPDNNSQVFADLQAIRYLLIFNTRIREVPVELPVSDLSPWLYQFHASHTSILIHIRALAAAGKLSDALNYANQCIPLCQKSDMTGVLIKFLIVRSRIRDAMGDLTGSNEDLLLAHELGDPLKFIRSFMDEPVYRFSVRSLHSSTLLYSGNDMIIPLTSREEEILGLIKQGLSNSEIAARLSISLSTVKKHISSIFRKIGVTSRSQAIVAQLKVKKTRGC